MYEDGEGWTVEISSQANEVGGWSRLEGYLRVAGEYEAMVWCVYFVAKFVLLLLEEQRKRIRSLSLSLALSFSLARALSLSLSLSQRTRGCVCVCVRARACVSLCAREARERVTVVQEASPGAPRCAQHAARGLAQGARDCPRRS